MSKKILFLMTALLMALASCQTTKTYQEHTTEDHSREVDSLLRTIYRLRQDSLFQQIELIKKDSVARYHSHTERMKGDTLYIIDTLFIESTHLSSNDRDTRRTTNDQRDSIAVDHQAKDSIKSEVIIQTKEVRKRSAYDKVISGGFWILLSFNLILFVYYILKKKRYI